MQTKLNQLYEERRSVCKSHGYPFGLCQECSTELVKKSVDAVLEEAVKLYPILGGFHGKISRRAREFLGVQ